MGAFSFCYGLTSVTIPNSVTTIEKDAFAMSGITDIYVSWSTSLPEIRRLDMFANKKRTLHIPKGALATYQSARTWNLFRIVEDVTDIE
jgi:hypothetical protein